MTQYHTTDYEKKIIRAICECRTKALGGRVEECDTCGHKLVFYNSCRNRHCPQCQFMKKEQWVMRKKAEVLPFQYFHVVFTLPDGLNPIVCRNKKLIYRLLFDTVKKTLLEVTGNKKYFGAKIGFFSILHTWGQKLNLHPHIHCVVPGGGYSPESTKWKAAKKDYLVPVRVLRKRFQYFFLTSLKRLYQNRQLYLDGTKYGEPVNFQELVDLLFGKKWVVYLKESFKNSDTVIEYLSRYTHRIAICNYRIKGLKNGRVYFSYRDYKRNNEKKIHSLEVLSFIRHFLLHIVPYRFVRIRYYGLLSHRNKRKERESCYEYYQKKIVKQKEKSCWHEIYLDVTGVDLKTCRTCGKGIMALKEVLSPVTSHGPPVLSYN